MSAAEVTGDAAAVADASYSSSSSSSSFTGDSGERKIKRRKVDARAAAASLPSASQSLVSRHYNSISRADQRLRVSSSIIGLRSYNNWVKSVLISTHCPPHAAVLDLCSGKGGDLRKFQQANIAQYVGADAAAGSVREAVDRYNKGGYAFPALFLTADCHRALLSQVLPPALWFDVVSCQFALHYSFETEQTARDFLYNAAERLLPDGHLIATFPDAHCLVGWLRKAEGHSFGNSILNVRFVDLADSPSTAQQPAAERKDESSDGQASGEEEQPQQPAAAASTADPPNSKHYFSPYRPFGIKYFFNLTDAIDDCPEYLVPMAVLQTLCAGYGLELVSATPLHRFLVQHIDNPQHLQLLKKMKIIDENEEDGTSLTEDEWEALKVYQAVVFRKLRPAEFGPKLPRPAFYTAPPAGYKRPAALQRAARPVQQSDIVQLRPDVAVIARTRLQQAALSQPSSSNSSSGAAPSASASLTPAVATHAVIAGISLSSSLPAPSAPP